MSTLTKKVFNAFIRTHHIISRKKVQHLRHAAEVHSVNLVVLRSGSAPGLIYVESSDLENVSAWVATVHGLRYKDYQNPRKPASAEVITAQGKEQLQNGFYELGTVSEFGQQMQLRGLMEWWQKAMGYKSG